MNVDIFSLTSRSRKRMRSNKKRQKFIEKVIRDNNLLIEKVGGVDVVTWDEIRLGNIFMGEGVSIPMEIFNGAYHFSPQGKSIVLDVGMNVGVATLYFAQRDDVEHVYGFEPVPMVYERALYNFSLNEKIRDKISTFNYGLADSEREVVVDFHETLSGATNILGFSVTRSRYKHEAIPINIKVNDVADEINRVIERHPKRRIVVKCDCEGAEKEIFERLDSAKLLSAIDVIIMEYHFGYDCFIEPFLQKNGFVYFKSGRSDIGIIRATRS